MESNKNNIDKSKNKLFKDNEFISQTKKAIHFTRLGNFHASEKIFKELISKSKYDYLTLHRLAGISLRLGKENQYLYYLKETIKCKKDYGEAYAELGNYFTKVGQIKNALNYFHMAVNFTPDLYGVYINIGNIFSDLERMTFHQLYTISEIFFLMRKILMVLRNIFLKHFPLKKIMLNQK